MPLPQYQILLLNHTTGDVVKVFDGASLYEMRYSRRLNDIGAIALTVEGTDENYALFAWDYFIEVMRTSPILGTLQTEETYLVRSKRVFLEDDKEMLVVGGLSLNHLIARRIIDPTDDPLATNGYSVKSGPADTVMRAFAREQMGDLASAARRIPNLTVAPVTGAGIPVDESKRYNLLYNALRDLAIASGIDFQISRTTDANMTLTIVRQGSDKTKSSNYPFGQWVGLTPLRRNLSNPELSIDRTDEQNFAYVLGQGQGEQRIVLRVAGDTSYSPFARMEYMKDSRNVDKTNTTGLNTAGLTSINKNKVNKNFSFKPLNIEPGAIYRDDYDIGDEITALWKGEQLDLRVAGIEITISESGEDLSVTVEGLYA
jgi:hypothetical protein